MFWCGSASKPDFRGQPRGAIVCYYIEELDTTTVATPKMWPAAVPRFYLFKAAHCCTIASRKIWGWYNIWRNRTHNRNVGQPYKHWPTTSNKITAATAVTFWLPPPPAAGRAPALYGPAPEPFQRAYTPTFWQKIFVSGGVRDRRATDSSDSTVSCAANPR